MITEKDAWTINGYLGIGILLIMSSVGMLSFFNQDWSMGIILIGGAVILASGLTIIQPNHSVIVQFAGSYVGTYRQSGIVLFVPFSKRIRVSLRERIFKSEPMQVHDIKGLPVSVSLVILFKIVDAAKSVYDVENVEKYISIQSEMSVRSLMTDYAHADLLTDDARLDEMTKRLQDDLYKRLKLAGIALTEIRAIPVVKATDHKVQENTLLPEKIIHFMEQENLLPKDEQLKNNIKQKLTTSLASE